MIIELHLFQILTNWLEFYHPCRKLIVLFFIHTYIILISYLYHTYIILISYLYHTYIILISFRSIIVYIDKILYYRYYFFLYYSNMVVNICEFQEIGLNTCMHIHL